MVVHPPSGRVIIGGNFNTLSGTTQLGMGSLDGTTGQVMPWAANQTIQNHDGSSAISSLTTDGGAIYGTGWAYFGGGATANFEGVFSADPMTGDINWIDGGRGDNYGIAVTGNVLYTVGHPHDWGMLGWNPQSDPLSYQRTMAIDKRGTPGLTNAFGTSDIWQPFKGMPASQPLHWLPTLTAGTYTGQNQAAWSVATNGDYVVEGGEFPKINGVAQQGLVRFAKRNVSPLIDAVQGYPELTPTLTAQGPGTVRVAWTAAWDRDNANLKVEVLRGDTVASSTVLKTFTTNTTWWKRLPLGFVDTTAPPGSTQTYRIRVTDPYGTGFASAPSSITIPSGSPIASPYFDSVRKDDPTWEWRLGETSGTTAYDRAGSNDLTLDPSNTRNAAGALLSEADASVNFPGSSNTATVQGASPFWELGPQTFSLEAWFNTTSTTGGKIIGFGSSKTGRSDVNNVGRHIYMNNAGQLYFGVRPDMGTRVTVNSPSSYRDGQWHQVVGTLGADGMKLYVDGNLVAANASVTKGQVYQGFWRVGGDQLGSWPSAPTREAFTGRIDEVAVYPTALSIGHIRSHYLASGRTSVFPNINPVASFDASSQYLTTNLTSTSTDDDGTIASSLWDFGDDTTGSGVTNQHTYAVAGTYNVTLTVTDDRGGTSSITQPVTVTDPPPNVLPSASFTSNILFHTATLTSTSSDSDGSIASTAWSFGDGTFGTGATTQHVYAQSGTYPVTVTVTDNRGGVASATSTVVVTDLYAQDTFARTVTNGLGTADRGGAWALTGPASSFSVANGAGRIGGAVNASNAGFLTAVRQTDFDTKVDLALSTAATGGGAYASVIERRVSNGNDYRLKLRYVAGGTVTAYLTRTTGNKETVLTSVNVPGLTVSAGTILRVRFQALGTNPTTLRAKVWRQSASEPVAWLLTTTDSTAALAAPGDLGVLLFTSSSWTGAAPAMSIDTLSSGPDSGSPANVPPVASFTSSVQGHTVSFTSTSTDPDGKVAASLWSFGDQTTGTGATNQHTYATAGIYPVTLTVTDNSGATGTVSGSVAITNVPPIASFTSSSQYLTTTFTSTSTDPDGSVASYAWDFGDTTTGTGASPVHTYPTAGTYPVTLTVTDTDGATNTATGSVTVVDPPPNVPPTANFTTSTLNHTVSFSSTSTDSDGTIASSSWDFGDATTGTGSSPSHTYATPGTYSVTLTVTDDRGAPSSVTHDVVIVNAAPNASFTSTAQYTVVTFASSSSDPDGTIASYAWDFGDNTTGTGASPVHPYPTGGTYPVTLTVTDNDGDTDTTTANVTVQALFDSDAFGRTVANGWGTADLGGTWAFSGTASSFSVTGGVGKIAGALRTNRAAFLTTARQVDVDLRADFSINTAGNNGGTYVSLIGRRVSNGNDYRLKLRYTANGVVTAFITRNVGNVETILATTTLTGTVNPGDVLKLRLQVAGTSPTTLSAKLWRATAAEPAPWLFTATDTTAALAAAGDAGVLHYVSGSWTGTLPTLSVDNFVAAPLTDG